ncbi:YcjX family protein [Proteus mirabilis]
MLAEIAAAYTEYLLACKKQGLHFIQPGRFVYRGIIRRTCFTIFPLG